MKQAQYNFSISGLLIGLILIAMMVTVMANLIVGLEREYPTASGVNHTFANYTTIEEQLNKKQDQLEGNINVSIKDVGVLDVIGGYFRGGYALAGTMFGSWGIFSDMMDQASNDVPMLERLKPLIIMFIIIGIGFLLLSALVKWRL